MEKLTPESKLCRFILSKKDFNLTQVKPRAFMPAQDLTLSVFLIDEISDSEIWELGITKVAAQRKKTLKARGDIQTRSFSDTSLNVEFDNTPPRHVNITNWPDSKPTQKIIARKLAAEATLSICPVE